MNHWTITKKPDPWEHIINNANYATDYEIGMLQDLDFGEYGVHPMELVAIDTDDKADGSGKARMTWKCKDLLCESVMGDDNYGGSTWETSVVRHLCNTNIYNQINNEFLKQNIKEVTKECIKYDMDNNSEQVYSCSDKVWILSYDELERYDPYDQISYTAEFWLRDSYYSSSQGSMFKVIGYDSEISTKYADNASVYSYKYVLPCFCI